MREAGRPAGAIEPGTDRAGTERAGTERYRPFACVVRPARAGRDQIAGSAVWVRATGAAVSAAGAASPDDPARVACDHRRRGDGDDRAEAPARSRRARRSSPRRTSRRRTRGGRRGRASSCGGASARGLVRKTIASSFGRRGDRLVLPAQRRTTRKVACKVGLAPFARTLVLGRPASSGHRATGDNRSDAQPLRRDAVTANGPLTRGPVPRPGARRVRPCPAGPAPAAPDGRIDFGRVYLGWVNLQNMTRIAANFAANNADAISRPRPRDLDPVPEPDPERRPAKNNCQLPTRPASRRPAPIARCSPATASATRASVSARPARSGSSRRSSRTSSATTVTVSASSDFPVKSAIIAAHEHAAAVAAAGPPSRHRSPARPRPAPSRCRSSATTSPAATRQLAWTINGPGGRSRPASRRTRRSPSPTSAPTTVTLVADNALNQPSTLTLGSYITVGVPSTGRLHGRPELGQGPAQVTSRTSRRTARRPGRGTSRTRDRRLDEPEPAMSTVPRQAGTYDVKLTVTNAAGPSSAREAVHRRAVAGLHRPELRPASSATGTGHCGPSGAGFTSTIVQDAPGAPNGNYTIDVPVDHRRSRSRRAAASIAGERLDERSSPRGAARDSSSSPSSPRSSS